MVRPMSIASRFLYYILLNPAIKSYGEAVFKLYSSASDFPFRFRRSRRRFAFASISLRVLKLFNRFLENSKFWKKFFFFFKSYRGIRHLHRQQSEIIIMSTAPKIMPEICQSLKLPKIFCSKNGRSLSEPIQTSSRATIFSKKNLTFFWIFSLFSFFFHFFRIFSLFSDFFSFLDFLKTNLIPNLPLIPVGRVSGEPCFWDLLKKKLKIDFCFSILKWILEN